MSGTSHRPNQTPKNTPPAVKEVMASRFNRATFLDRERHQNVQLNRRLGFGFARYETAVPLVATEFASAARDLPIVFAGDDRMPLAILGIRSQENLWVDAEGNWKEGRYIPAHFRRYPFILQEDEAGQQFALCIDEEAEHFKAGKNGVSEPLFIEKEPAPLVTEMLNFLGDMQQGLKVTQAYVAALREADLLIERNALIELNNGEKIQFDGFYVIDENKFNALPQETFLEWRAKGWLALTHFHLQSQLNWQHLVELAV